MKSLEERHRDILTIAVGIAVLMKGKRNPDNILKGLRALANIITEEDKDMFMENAQKILAERDKYQEEDGEILKVLEGLSTGEAMDTVDAMMKKMYHGMSREEKLKITYVGIAKGMQCNQMAMAAAGSLMLAKLVTDKDIEEAKAIILKSCKECGCDDCKQSIKYIDRIIMFGIEKVEEMDKHIIEDPFLDDYPET